jgi:hypothetical protein
MYTKGERERGRKGEALSLRELGRGRGRWWWWGETYNVC